MATTPAGEPAMSLLFLLLLSLFPTLGVMTDRDDDGVKTFKDCNDSDPSLQVTWCMYGVCGSPHTCDCLEPGRLHEDPNFEQVWCPELGKERL